MFTRKVSKVKLKELASIYELEKMYMIEYEPDHLKKWEKNKFEVMRVFQENINRLFVMRDEGHVIAFAYWSLLEDKPCVYSIVVHPNYRRQHLGFKLLRALEASVQEAGYDQLTLSTLSKNPAQHLFESCGFIKLKNNGDWMNFEKKFDSQSRKNQEVENENIPNTGI